MGYHKWVEYRCDSCGDQELYDAEFLKSVEEENDIRKRWYRITFDSYNDMILCERCNKEFIELTRNTKIDCVHKLMENHQEEYEKRLGRRFEFLNGRENCQNPDL